MKKILIALLALSATPAFALEKLEPLVCRDSEASVEVNVMKEKNGKLMMRVYYNGATKAAVKGTAEEKILRCRPIPGGFGCPSIFKAQVKGVNYSLMTSLKQIERKGSARGSFTQSYDGQMDSTEVRCEIARRVYNPRN